MGRPRAIKKPTPRRWAPALWKHSPTDYLTLTFNTMLYHSILALLAASLLAQAAPAPLTPGTAAVPRAGYLASGAPMSGEVYKACGKHGCWWNGRKRVDVAAPSEDDDGSGSFDLAPELSPVIEGLRNSTDADGIFA
ncbi:hypothetical protein PsYK624_118630 [Phanerochaete sordida]|uniref:Uncharacterized protein n=1 Tax=Phanerochaete sordida TaxID=48140 RepID=A0A9P3GHF3_9APHY|nr:hypothetical protein PsYK624_118630 [Phanerochaete sordida]